MGLVDTIIRKLNFSNQFSRKITSCQAKTPTIFYICDGFKVLSFTTPNRVMTRVAILVDSQAAQAQNVRSSVLHNYAKRDSRLTTYGGIVLQRFEFVWEGNGFAGKVNYSYIL